MVNEMPPKNDRWVLRTGHLKLVALLATILVYLAIGGVGKAGASPLTQEEELGRFGSRGSGAGQLWNPSSLASDEGTGEVFVGDSNNERVDVFDAWGRFLRAWGWGVATEASALETCTATCTAGNFGSGAGQFRHPLGVTVDGDHSVFVFDYDNARVQKFSASGEFLLMFGGEVNKTTNANICTKADLEGGDECGAGVKGSSAGFFHPAIGGTFISHDASGNIVVGDDERIQVFNGSGNLVSQITGGVLSGNDVEGLAVDQSSGDIYAILMNRPNVYRLNSAGALLDELAVPDPVSVAADAEGNVFVIDAASFLHPERVLEFNASGEETGELEREDEQSQEDREVQLLALGTNGIGDLYVTHAGGPASYIVSIGPPPLIYGPPPPAPPTITAQFPSAVGTGEADLKAQINPHFWADTTFYVEYGTGSCAAGECDAVQPVPPGPELGKAVNRAVSTDPIHLAGLQPDTTYHFRFVSESSGGGPVYGIDPDGEGPEEATFEDGLERTFTTFPEEDPIPPCPNHAFRSGASALLPDCRAYEMVSPVDKANGDIVAPINITGFENRLNQSSLDGEKLTYSSYRAFGGSKGASYVSQYIASRGDGGWTTEALAEQRGPGFYDAPNATENEFKAFSPDLCSSWLVREAEPLLAAGAVPGYPNAYRRDNCPTAYEALTTVQPPTLVPVHFRPEIQGYSGDGSKAIFRVNDNLTVDAPPQPQECADQIAAKGLPTACLWRVYETGGGDLSLVCILPNETPNPGNCSAGSPGASLNRTSNVRHAMSEDGSRIYWSASAEPTKPGIIYLRLNRERTVPVSGKASSAEAQFWGASADGSRALFSIEDQSTDASEITVLNHNLYLYSLESESTSLIARKAMGVAGAGEDLSYVYFVSEEAIGGKGTAGEPNLYLWNEGTSTFIATLSSEDVRLEGSQASQLPSDATPGPVFQATHVSADGRRLAFISTEPLTGFDNTDAVSGKADSEVFTYAAETETLDCVSCSPVGVRSTGRSVQAPGNGDSLSTAAYVPLGENQLYTPRVISEDGSRLFFTSFADLLPRDENGKADVYEWELAGTSESCKGESDPDFYPANGGCLFLISSGQSPQDSEFVDSSPSGRDAFFTTQQSLLSMDPDLLDIYDARIEGGFTPVEPPPQICEGEPCPHSPPAFSAPASNRPGTPNPPLKQRIKCPKGKHRVVKGGKERCVRKHKHKRHKGKRRAHKRGGQGR